MSAHARLGPSNHRWPNCPGSVREEANYPDISGPAAIDGTGSHLLLEMCLDNGVRADVYDGRIIGVNHPDNLGGWMVDIERVKRVQMCLDYISTRVKDLRTRFANVTVSSETTVDIGSMFGRTDWWGTVDVTIVGRDSKANVMYVEVCDYKDGRGYVHAIDNTQLISYAAGVIRPHVAQGPQRTGPYQFSRVTDVRMSIVQPKTNPVVRYQDVKGLYIAQHINELALAAERTDDLDAPLIADKKSGKGYCQWCKHKKNCTAQTAQSIEAMKMTTDVATTGISLFEMVAEAAKDVTALDSDKLGQLMDAEAGMQALFDKVKVEITRRIDDGQTVNGFGMVNSRASKVWALDEEEMIKKFKSRKLTQDEYAPRKLISPAQAMKLSKLTNKQKEVIEEEFVVVKAGPKKLGRVSYAKKEKDVNEMFANISDESVGQSATESVTSEIEVSFF